jgi:Spy/CpxP family protein refolding chaperone
MLWKQTLSIIFTLALVVPGALAAQERPHQHEHREQDMMHPGPMMAMPAMVLMHAEDLGLTPQQRERIETLHAETQRTAMPVMQQMREVHREAAAITQAERFDGEAARGVARQAGELHAQMMPAMLRAQHQVDQVLTPDQRRQLERLHQEHGGAGPGHQGMGMMMHCPMMQGGMQHEGGHEHQHR